MTLLLLVLSWALERRSFHRKSVSVTHTSPHRHHSTHGPTSILSFHHYFIGAAVMVSLLSSSLPPLLLPSTQPPPLPLPLQSHCYCHRYCRNAFLYESPHFASNRYKGEMPFLLTLSMTTSFRSYNLFCVLLCTLTAVGVMRIYTYV